VITAPSGRVLNEVGLEPDQVVELDPEQVEKERGVVIEEWRGRLGAFVLVIQAVSPYLLTKRAPCFS